MQQLLDNQCRRCGRVHEEVWQMSDHDGCWALTTTTCECGHHWTMIYTAPANQSLLRAWIDRGCVPAEGPVVAVHKGTWRAHRLEGVSPAIVAAAS